MRNKAAISLAACLLVVLLLVACAPRSPEKVTGGDFGKNPIASVAWSPDADCSTCHTNRAKEGNTSSENHRALEAGIDCTTCHLESEMTEVHEKHGDSGREPSRLRYSDVTNEGCLDPQCHSVEAALEQTAGVVVSDSEGTAKNPHEVLSQEGHQDIDCIDCHTMHKEEDVLSVSETTCFGCHHEQVFECGTCHV